MTKTPRLDPEVRARLDDIARKRGVYVTDTKDLSCFPYSPRKQRRLVNEARLYINALEGFIAWWSRHDPDMPNEPVALPPPDNISQFPDK